MCRKCARADGGDELGKKDACRVVVVVGARDMMSWTVRLEPRFHFFPIFDTPPPNSDLAPVIPRGIAMSHIYRTVPTITTTSSSFSLIFPPPLHLPPTEPRHSTVRYCTTFGCRRRSDLFHFHSIVYCTVQYCTNPCPPKTRHFRRPLDRGSTYCRLVMCRFARR